MRFTFNLVSASFSYWSIHSLPEEVDRSHGVDITSFGESKLVSAFSLIDRYILSPERLINHVQLTSQTLVKQNFVLPCRINLPALFRLKVKRCQKPWIWSQVPLWYTIVSHL